MHGGGDEQFAQRCGHSLGTGISVYKVGRRWLLTYILLLPVLDHASVSELRPGGRTESCTCRFHQPRGGWPARVMSLRCPESNRQTAASALFVGAAERADGPAADGVTRLCHTVA